jgi:class 3 adenylate cyclase
MQTEVAILYADIVGFTEMTERLGDARAFAVMQRYLDLLRGCAKETCGREIELRGDACLLAFDEAEQALACAVALQRGLAEQRRSDPDHGVGVRIGLHSGRPIPHDGGFFGRDVILAARLSDAGRHHSIVASRAFRRQLDDTSRVGRERNLRLKGFLEPQPASRIFWGVREGRAARQPNRFEAFAAWSFDRLCRLALFALPEGTLRSRS